MGTLVVEAAEKSGSLISARYAADQGREVFAIPGSPLDPRAKGTNKLIRDGAVLTESVEDILAELVHLRQKSFNDPEELPLFGFSSPHGSDAADTTEAEAQITEKDRDMVLELLGPSPVHIDEVIRLADLSPGSVQAIILMLELAGSVVRYPGGRIARLADF